jgi:curved DNA-binding protein
MDYKDYYKILGVDKNASAEDIKKAYRKLAVKYHPDKNPGDKQSEEKFKEVNEANEVLGNPENRKKYDQMSESYQYARQHGGTGGFDWSQWQQAQQPRGAHTYTYQGDFGDVFGGRGGGGFSDFFESFFGGTGGFAGGAGRQRRTMSRKGEDYRAQMEISLEEAFLGAEKIVNINGQKIRMKLKPGTEHGQVLRLKGKGGPGGGGAAAGDLLITVQLVSRPGTEIKGRDLYVDTPIDVFTATLGGKATINTLKGAIKVDIPPGSDSGKMLRLKGLGLPGTNGTAKGDLYVKVMIEVPKNLSEKEKQLFDQIAKNRK